MLQLYSLGSYNLQVQATVSIDSHLEQNADSLDLILQGKHFLLCFIAVKGTFYSLQISIKAESPDFVMGYCVIDNIVFSRHLYFMAFHLVFVCEQMSVDVGIL